MPSSHLKAVIFDIGGVVIRSPLLAIAAFEEEKGLPRNYINCAISRSGQHGAWQRFERGELALFPFYDAFGRELSDTGMCNPWYAEYCQLRNIACPKLPENIQIDGRDLFGRMMRESNVYDEKIVEAIRRIRASRGSIIPTDCSEVPYPPEIRPISYHSQHSLMNVAVKRWRVIALTNNYSKAEDSILGPEAGSMPSRERYPDFSVDNERAFLGWTEGVTPPKMLALFDDFCDSSVLGMRKPDPEFYLLACRRNSVLPRECVFLDDLGMNLKVAQQLGMKTIHVPIGESLAAIRELEKELGIDLTGPRIDSKL